MVYPRRQSCIPVISLSSLVFFYWVVLNNGGVALAFSLQSRTNSGALLSIEGLTCSHNGGTVYQLDNVDYILQRGAKIGLVGKNGCGKSTFLKIIAESCGLLLSGQDDLRYSGTIQKQSSSCRVAYVEQDPPMPSDITVYDSLLGITSITTTTTTNTLTSTDTQTDTTTTTTTTTTDTPQDVYSVVRDYRLAMLLHDTHTNNNNNNNHDHTQIIATASDNMEQYNGWDVLTRLEELASKLRLADLKDKTLHTLSGGERKRVALAAALLQQPDLLLLDEPTNHLDLPGIQFLTDVIQEANNHKMTVLTITHDRAFLQQVCTNGIVELDQGKLFEYIGSYDTFLEQKQQRLIQQEANYQANQNKLRQELEWVRKQPQARETKQKFRIQAYEKLKKATPPKQQVDTPLALDKGDRRLGKSILKCDNISLKFDQSKIILQDFSYNFNRGDRIGIVGPNGVGKSTFLKVLLGLQPINAGTITVGETIVFGMYNQLGLTIHDDNIKVLQFVQENVEARDGSSLAEAPQEARNLLTQFQFPRSRWNERIATLSGGEQRRLQLLSVLTKRPNFLVLDEPTNDIDLDTLTVLEEYLLQTYNGVLVIVSHDRYFTDKVTNHLFVLEGNGIIKDYTGTLTEYASCLLEDSNTSISGMNSSPGTTTSYKEEKKIRMQRTNEIKQCKRTMERLEKKMDGLKRDISKLEQELESSSEEGWTILAQLTDEIQQKKDTMEESELEWLELAEQIELYESEQ